MGNSGANGHKRLPPLHTAPPTIYFAPCVVPLRVLRHFFSVFNSLVRRYSFRPPLLCQKHTHTHTHTHTPHTSFLLIRGYDKRVLLLSSFVCGTHQLQSHTGIPAVFFSLPCPSRWRSKYFIFLWCYDERSQGDIARRQMSLSDLACFLHLLGDSRAVLLLSAQPMTAPLSSRGYICKAMTTAPRLLYLFHQPLSGQLALSSHKI